MFYELLTQRILYDLLEDLGANDDPDLRERSRIRDEIYQQAGKRLAKLGTPTIPYLIDQADIYRPWGLITQMGKTAADPLITYLRNHPNSPYIANTLKTLGSLRCHEAVEILMEYLSHPYDLHLRTEAAWALGKLEYREGAKATLRLLDKLLAQNKHLSGKLMAYSYPRMEQLCENTVFALGMMRNDLATDSLLKLLSTNKPRLKLRTVQALAHIGNHRAISPIMTHINPKEKYADIMVRELVRFGRNKQMEAFAVKFCVANPTLKYIGLIRRELAALKTASGQDNYTHSH